MNKVWIILTPFYYLCLSSVIILPNNNLQTLRIKRRDKTGFRTPIQLLQLLPQNRRKRKLLSEDLIIIQQEATGASLCLRVGFLMPFVPWEAIVSHCSIQSDLSPTWGWTGRGWTELLHSCRGDTARLARSFILKFCSDPKLFTFAQFISQTFGIEQQIYCHSRLSTCL